MSNTRLSLLFASESLTNEGPICTRHTFVYFLKISVNDSMLPVRTVIFSSTKFCEPLPNFNSTVVLPAGQFFCQAPTLADLSINFTDLFWNFI